MAALSPASGSVKGSDVLVSLQTRLVESTELDPRNVRIVVRPSPVPVEYRAERNIALRFHAPDPDTEAGAGRYGQLITRVLEVWCYTQNLLDMAGEDEKMAISHLDFEELVMNTMVDTRPTDLQLDTDEHVALLIRFLPGGAEIERQVKADAGIATSCLLFEVKYQAKYTVYRD